MINEDGSNYIAIDEIQGETLLTVTMFYEALRDMENVTHTGGMKHGYGSWLEPNNPSLQHKSNCASMFRHAAEISCGIQVDPESGMAPELHLAWRAMASYVRRVRNIGPETKT